MEDTLAQKPVKTYSKIDNNPSKTAQKRCYKTRITVVVKREPLTTKKAIELLLNGTLKRDVCRYCMNVTNVLNDLDQIMHISGKDVLYKVSIRDMVATFHPFKVVDDPNFPKKICEKCLNEVTRSYLFAQQCERSERAIRNCFDDMYEQLEKLDPLERTKKRGRQKQNPNKNTLRTEHKYVIDYADPIHYLINSGTVPLTNETMMTDLECKRCWQVLPNLESLVNHEKLHPKTMWYSCRLCGKSFAKKFHLKKHLRSHKNFEAISKSEKAFECKECGYTSEDYHTHLQHIEKHKFRRVFQQLLKRKMDTLCSVCLDNRSKMTDLDKTICLHGGYPELTGERSVFNILGASVPELKQKYKYQDLCIPYQADIMAIIKKSKDEELYSKEKYIISAPIILSTEKKEYDKPYLFIFAEPLINLEQVITNDDFTDEDNELITNNHEQNAETSDCYNYESDKKEFNGKVTGDNYDFDERGHNTETIPLDMNMENKYENSIPAQENVNFIFSKPDYSIDDKSNDSFIETKKYEVKQCKVCWIFKKPTCKDCVSGSNEEEELKLYNRREICQIKLSDITTEKKPCKFCWIFNNNNCNVCKSSRKTEHSFSKISTTVGRELKISEKKLKLKKREHYEVSDIITEATSNNVGLENVNKSMKRKIAEDSYKMSTKRPKWQCNVCLTVNTTNRETCICCDHYVLDSETSVNKFNWGRNKIFASNIRQKVVKDISTFTDNIIFNIIPEMSDLETNVELKVKFTKEVNNKQEELPLSMEEESNEPTKIYEDMEISENIVPTVEEDINVEQTIDQKLGGNGNNNNTHQAYNLNISSFDNTNMDFEDISDKLPSMLQFSIGKGSRNEKKILRPFKKPLRTSKK